MEFDPICFSKINKLLKSGGFGKIETTTLTFGGSTAGADIFGNGTLYTKISNNPLDLATVERLSLFWQSLAMQEAATFNYSKEDFNIFDDGNNAIIAVKNPDLNSENPEDLLWVVLSVRRMDEDLGIEPGLYVVDVEVHDETISLNSHISRIECETTHPIDPKFLPGVCLPKVIDLSEYHADDGYSLNDHLLTKFAIGGGRQAYQNTDELLAFWEDISTDRRTQFIVRPSGYEVIADINSITTAGGKINSIEVSFAIPDANTVHKVTAMFIYNLETTYITVITEKIALS